MTDEPVYSVLSGKSSTLGLNSVIISGSAISAVNGTYTRIANREDQCGISGSAAYQKGSLYLVLNDSNWRIGSDINYGSMGPFMHDGCSANGAPYNGITVIRAGTWAFSRWETDFGTEYLTVTTT